jgi:hypothetical protein
MPTVAWPSRSLTTFGWTPGLQRHRRVGVAQVVQPDAGQARLPHDRVEPLAHAVGVHRHADLVGEHVVLVGVPRRPRCEPIRQLGRRRCARSTSSVHSSRNTCRRLRAGLGRTRSRSRTSPVCACWRSPDRRHRSRRRATAARAPRLDACRWWRAPRTPDTADRHAPARGTPPSSSLLQVTRSL